MNSFNALKYCLLATLTIACLRSVAQKQLVVLKREKVIMRFNPGDQFIISLKGEDRKIDSYINNLFDTAVVVHRTTVPLYKIDRIYFKQTGLVNLIGKFLVSGGVAYFVIDQFNIIVVEGEEPNLDEEVTTVSAAMVAAGLPMMLIKKKSQRIRGKYRMLTVGPESPFYLEPANVGTDEQ